MLVLAAMAAFSMWWVHQVVAQWSSHTAVFVSAVALVFGLVMLLDWVIASFGPPLARFVVSVARSMWAGALADAEVRAFAQRHPRLSAWLARRTTTERWTGIGLTLTVAATLYFASGFASIAQRAAGTGVLAAYDTQLSALLRAFRTPDLTRLLWVFTVMGDPRVAYALVAIAVALLLLWGRRLDALFVALSVSGGSLLGAIAKPVFHRARPDAAFALIREPASFSLPSGHALYALLLWGAIAFLLVRGAKTAYRRLAALAVCAAMAVLTGLSRVYLGVHWPSDVLASWALALAWLSACIGAYLMWNRYGRTIDRPASASHALRLVALAAAAVLGGAVVVGGASADPLLAKAVATEPTRQWVTAVDARGLPAPTPSQAHELPTVSEKLDGAPQEPIGLIFVGSKDQLVDAFVRRGWSVADRPTPLSLLHALATAYSDKPYPTAPVTPSFLGGRVHDVAFEKPEGQATVRRRHHCRWWKTGFTFQGEPVWVATASFDASLEIGSAIPVLTHHIAPDIDAEQAYIVHDLEAAGVLVAGQVRVSNPMSGTNAQGDQWYTQGLATVLVAR